MRYMKIYAHDVLDNDVPDVVTLEFHDDTCTPTLVHQATTFDITDDGQLDWVIADDVNQDGVVDAVDRAQAIELAQLFLEFNWFSLDEPFDKYLKVFARDFDVFKISFHLTPQIYEYISLGFSPNHMGIKERLFLSGT